MSDLAGQLSVRGTAAAREERCEAITTVGEYLREYFRDGSSDVRVVISNVPRGDWNEIEGRLVRRFPEGQVKIERLCIGVDVEWVLGT